MLSLFIKIGFFEIRVVDLFDILIVGLLLFQLYRLIRSSLAFNIFLGLLIIYLTSLLVKSLEMDLLSGILGSFIDLGVIALLIVFQPEVRRFLLYLGRESGVTRRDFWKRIRKKQWKLMDSPEQNLAAILRAIESMAESKTGALIVFARTSKLQFFANTGAAMDAKISQRLLESIFNGKSPLHDGAVIIADHRIMAAQCILPVSENPDIPKSLGLRHRAAIGITENSDAIALIVSEETGGISYASEGKLRQRPTMQELTDVLKNVLQEDFE